MAIRNITAEHQRMKENEIALARLFFQQCCGETYGEHCTIPVNHGMFTFWKNLDVCGLSGFPGKEPDVKLFAGHLRLFADLLDPPAEAP